MSNGDREGKSVWVWPSKITRISGFRFSIPKHPGIDIGTPLDTPIFSPGRGTVSYAGWNNQGYGNLVIITTAAGFKFYLAHLNEINVRVGDSVRAGETVALSGSTGNSSGPHLHFEVRKPGGGFLDPLKIEWGKAPPGSTPPGGTPDDGDNPFDGATAGASGVEGNIRISTPAGIITVSNPFKGLINYVETIKWGNVLAVGAGVALVVVGVYAVTTGEFVQKGVTVVKDIAKVKSELPV